MFLARLAALIRRQQMDRDLDDEIASHLAEATDEYIRQGLSPEEAHWAAQRSFGGVSDWHHACRLRLSDTFTVVAAVSAAA
jgi:hypothetical protein